MNALKFSKFWKNFFCGPGRCIIMGKTFKICRKKEKDSHVQLHHLQKRFTETSLSFDVALNELNRFFQISVQINSYEHHSKQRNHICHYFTKISYKHSEKMFYFQKDKQINSYTRTLGGTLSQVSDKLGGEASIKLSYNKNTNNWKMHFCEKMKNVIAWLQ